jgi:hypothetical protein
MRARAAVFAGLAVAVTVSGEADAAVHKAKHKPKPVCNLAVDPAGDAPLDLSGGLAPSKMPNDANGDILSADLASDGKFVTAVIRVKTLATPDTTFPEAHLYMLSWTAPGHHAPVYLGATVDPSPASAAYGPQYVFGDSAEFHSTGFIYYNIGSTAKGTVDARKNTITLSVPISAIRSYGKFTPGSRFTGLEASTQALANGPVLPTNVAPFGGSITLGFQEDVADASKDYVAGTRSCVKPGS